MAAMMWQLYCGPTTLWQRFYEEIGFFYCHSKAQQPGDNKDDKTRHNLWAYEVTPQAAQPKNIFILPSICI